MKFNLKEIHWQHNHKNLDQLMRGIHPHNIDQIKDRPTSRFFDNRSNSFGRGGGAHGLGNLSKVCYLTVNHLNSKRNLEGESLKNERNLERIDKIVKC